MFLATHDTTVRSSWLAHATAIEGEMPQLKDGRMRGCAKGFTMFELAFVVAIGMVVTTISVPMTKTALKAYHLNTAVSAVTGAIQSTRYQAIMHGYHYNLSLVSGSQSYQVGTKVPPATAFSNVGAAIPWCTTGDVTMSSSTTLEFFPGGTVTATSGSMTFSVSNGTATKTITVSGVGNVTVTP
jgi:Tfp pilus assembly protein FimT